MVSQAHVLSRADASIGMMRREVTVLAADVVFVKGIVEASEGLAAVFAEQGGELSIVSPREREAEVTELVEDLKRDVAARVSPAVFVPAEPGHGRGVDFGRNELG